MNIVIDGGADMVKGGFYQYKGQVVYLRDFQNNNQNDIDLVCNKAQKNIHSNRSIYTNWNVNPYLIGDMEYRVPIKKFKNFEYMNQRCQNCIYYRRVPIDNLNSSEEFFGGICDLRNDWFADECKQLFVDCQFCETDEKNVFQKVRTDVELDFCDQIVSNLFDSIDYEDLNPKTSCLNVRTGYYCLTPIEFTTLLNMSPQNSMVYFSDIQNRFTTEEKLSENNTIYKCKIEELSLSEYYKSTKEDLHYLMFSDSQLWGLTVDFRVAKAGYNIAGDPCFLNEYSRNLCESNTCENFQFAYWD